MSQHNSHYQHGQRQGTQMQEYSAQNGAMMDPFAQMDRMMGQMMGGSMLYVGAARRCAVGDAAAALGGARACGRARGGLWHCGMAPEGAGKGPRDARDRDVPSLC